jgi:hypothetical protein
MTEQVLNMLEGSRYSPVTYQGEPRDVRFVFPVRVSAR